MEYIKLGDLTICPCIPRLYVCGKEIKLTVRQRELLMALAYCANSLVTRRMLLAVMQRNRLLSMSMNSLEIEVSRLRSILAAHSGGRNFIRTVPEGFVLVDPGPFVSEDRRTNACKLAA